MVATSSPTHIARDAHLRRHWGSLVGSDPDPRVLQSVVAILVAVDLIACDIVGEGYTVYSGPTVALVLVSVATAVALLVPWRRVPAPALVVLPLVDILALGLLRLSPHDGGASVVVVVPAVWLARQHGRRGAALAVVAVALLHSVPRVIYHGEDAPISGAILLPLVAGIAAMGATMALETVQSRTREAEARGRDLERALAQLEREQRQNQAVLDTVDIGLLLLGPDGSYQTMNRQLMAFIGLAYPQGPPSLHEVEVTGVVGDVFAEDGVTRVAPEQMATLRAMRGEEFEDHRIWVGAEPGSRRALSVSARTLRDADGGFAGAALAFKDVTDLVGALQVKDEFVATVSHELRTPLTSIIGYVDLLREGDGLADRARHQLDIVHRNGERLLHVVEDLLHTAQLAGGRSQLSLGPSDLVRLAREAVAAAQPAATAAGVRVGASLPGEMPVRVDAGRIGQVLDNLLSNAVKYNRPGGAVTLVLGRVGDTALLEVRDTGFGMLPRECEQLFTRFYRARHAADHAIPGAGLGLSITRAIVEAHEGTIDVESTVDVGTVVSVRLPLRPAETGSGTAPGVSVGRG